MSAPSRIFDLDGRVALIAGGSGGIGVPIAETLASAGAAVALVARSQERVEAAAERVGATGARVLPLAADLTRKADADRAAESTVGELGRLDILVNAIGGGAGGALHPAEDYPEGEWDRMFDLNLRSSLLPAQAAARAMVEGGRGGRILNISSVRGQLGIDAGFSAYCAAKGALNALTRQHATEWAKHGITVNAIAPTFVRTPQVEDLLADPDFEAGIVARIPVGRIGETGDLAGAALFFCSDASSFVTGQVLGIDGGLTATQ